MIFVKIKDVDLIFETESSIFSPWYKNKLTSVFGGVKVQGIGGYYVFVAEKRSRITKKKTKSTKDLSRKLQRKQRCK